MRLSVSNRRACVRVCRLARNETTKSVVAVKMLGSPLHHMVLSLRALREAKLLRYLSNHENILELKEIRCSERTQNGTLAL